MDVTGEDRKGHERTGEDRRGQKIVQIGVDRVLEKASRSSTIYMDLKVKIRTCSLLQNGTENPQDFHKRVHPG